MEGSSDADVKKKRKKRISAVSEGEIRDRRRVLPFTTGEGGETQRRRGKEREEKKTLRRHDLPGGKEKKTKREGGEGDITKASD